MRCRIALARLPFFLGWRPSLVGCLSLVQEVPANRSHRGQSFQVEDPASATVGALKRQLFADALEVDVERPGAVFVR